MNAQALNVADVERLQQAADWFIRLKEEPGDATVAAWMEWCEADPQNLTAFEDIKSVWMASDASKAAVEASMQPDAVQVVAHIPVGSRRPSWRFVSPMWPVGIGAFTLAVSALLYVHLTSTAEHVFSTPLAVHSDSVLEDGSHLKLGALTRVSTQFSERERLIVMESGEAFFQVAKDHKRPFVVQAGPISITAIGTAFNIRRGVESIVVTVTEGRVGVATERRQLVQVEAGQQISYSHSEHRFAVAPVDSVLAMSWQRGVFKYVREPLINVVADLNRYRTRRIIIKDDTLGKERYTGTVFGTRMDDWLVALQSAFPVRIVDTPDAVVLMRRDANEPANPNTTSSSLPE